MGAAMFGLGVGKHEGSVFSPLLLIIMLEALYMDFPAGYPFKNGPRREKTCLRGFQQSEIQTSLIGYIKSLEI